MDTTVASEIPLDQTPQYADDVECVDAYIFETDEDGVGLELALFSPLPDSFTPVLRMALVKLDTAMPIDGIEGLYRDLDQTFVSNYMTGHLEDDFERFFIHLAEHLERYGGDTHPAMIATIEQIACMTEIYDLKDFREFIYGVTVMVKLFNPEPTIH